MTFSSSPPEAVPALFRSTSQDGPAAEAPRPSPRRSRDEVTPADPTLFRTREKPGALKDAQMLRDGLEATHRTAGLVQSPTVDRIAPQPVLFITTDDDRLVPRRSPRLSTWRAEEACGAEGLWALPGLRGARLQRGDGRGARMVSRVAAGEGDLTTSPCKTDGARSGGQRAWRGSPVPSLRRSVVTPIPSARATSDVVRYPACFGWSTRR